MAGRVIRFALTSVTPIHKSIPFLVESFCNRIRNGSWRCSPTDVELKEGNKTEMLKINSLGAMCDAMTEVKEGAYTPEARLPSSPIIFDCGANIGFTIRQFKKDYPDSTIHAFEAAKENIELLEYNTRQLKNVRINHAAVSDFQGKTTINIHKEPNSSSIKNIPGAIRTERTSVLTLKGYMEENKIPRIDLLKLDIEGSELDALNGLKEKIGTVGVIVGEAHHDLVDLEEFKRFLEERGFRLEKWQKQKKGIHYLFEAVNKSVH